MSGVPVGERIFDAKPATPAMAEEMDPAQLQRLANRFGFGDIARDGPKFLIRRAVGSAGAELVKGDNAVTLVDQQECESRR